jgi:hypothetical protein
MTRRTLAAILLAALAGAGCNIIKDVTQPSPTPSATGPDALSGTWASVSSTTTLQNTCTDFKWLVTSVQDTTGTGTFSATCLGDMAVTGTASGVLSGTTLNWTATATGTSPTVSSCDISLNGTATFENNQIRVPFSGTTCLGPVSGTEILRK